MPSSLDLTISAQIVKNSHVVQKLWGYEAWLENNPKYCAKLLQLKPGFQSSLHYHTYKDETFIVLSGEVFVELTKPAVLVGAERAFIKKMLPGDKQRLFPGIPHRFWTDSDEALVLEVSTTHDDSDVTRIEESRQRVSTIGGIEGPAIAP